MSMRSLESAITREARVFFNNRKLRVKDLMEWSTGEIKPHEGEVIAKLPLNGVYIAVKTECDKRSNAEVRGFAPTTEPERSHEKRETTK